MQRALRGFLSAASHKQPRRSAAAEAASVSDWTAGEKRGRAAQRQPTFEGFASEQVLRQRGAYVAHSETLHLSLVEATCAFVLSCLSFSFYLACFPYADYASSGIHRNKLFCFESIFFQPAYTPCTQRIIKYSEF